MITETLHYLKFNRKTGKSELVIKELPIGTIESRSQNFRAKTKTRTAKMRAKRLKAFRAKASRMYNFLFN